MDVKKSFAKPELEANGVWIEYRDGGKVLLARMGNPKFQAEMDRLLKPFRRKSNPDPQKQTEVLCRCLANSVLLDWEGFTDDGAELKYSKDAAARLLERHMDFRNDVVRLASEEQHFYEEELGADAKN